jgi:hypothetical protein
MGDVLPGALAPVLRTDAAEASEQALGFAVPALLKLVYRKRGTAASCQLALNSGMRCTAVSKKHNKRIKFARCACPICNGEAPLLAAQRRRFRPTCRRAGGAKMN